LFKQGLSQKEVAKKLGVSSSHVSRFSRGELNIFIVGGPRYKKNIKNK
jgi:transcriptional regulator with XRE-family HTH domain